MATVLASFADGSHTITLRFPVRRTKGEASWGELSGSANGAYFLRQVLQALLTWLVFLLLSASENGPTSCRGRALRIGAGIKEIEGQLVAVVEDAKD
jgi:hypothetical protein